MRQCKKKGPKERGRRVTEGESEMGPVTFGCWKMINSHAVVALERVD